MHRPRLLNLNKKYTQGFVQFLVHNRRFDSKERIDVLDVFKILVEAQFPQNIAHLIVIDLGHILDTLLLDSGSDRPDHLFRDLGRLFGLELRQDLLEMVETDVGRIGHLVRRLFVRGFAAINDVGDELTAILVIAYENALFVLGDHLTTPAELADV